MTIIFEKKSLSKMISATLFEKLQEYEIKLGRLEKHENQDNKYKSISLKVDSKEVEIEDNPEEGENFIFLVKRWDNLDNNNTNFVKLKKFFNKKESSTSTQDVTYHECKKQRHIKPNYSKLAKKNFKRRKVKKKKLSLVRLTNVWSV